ncbi:MAG: exopolysaccharide biosynthesis protein [Sulfitobacter sp.]|nr:exopolysaccharide biosynthesis protein [Sulfitobacter sp.]
MAAQDASSVTGVVEALRDLAKEEDQVSVGDVTDAFGKKGFGPLMLVPALLVITPLGGIPTFPTIMAIIILLFALQVIFQRDGLWLPQVLERRSVSNERVKQAASKLKPVTDWIDRVTGARLTALTNPPVPSIAAGVIALMCLTVPFAEMIPFAAILPMGAIALLALALTVEDGLVMLVGLTCSAGALIGLGLWVF